jgi:hypothetical protein
MKKFLAEGRLLKEDTQSTLKRNQAYITKYTLLKDPNIGQDVVITSPYTADKISQAILPLLKKGGVYDENYDPGIFQSLLKGFKGWLQNNISNYDILQKEKLTAREIFDQIYYDFEFEVNELDNKDSDGEHKNEFYDEDGNLDEDILMNFIQDTLTSKGYNIPEEIWDDMTENAYSGDMFSEDEEGEYENFSEQDAYNLVEDYIKMLRNFSNSPGYEFMEFPEYFKNMSIEDFKN